MVILYMISFLVAIVYSAIIMYFVLGWQETQYFEADETQDAPVTKVSIIIPARNEANNIEQCLQSIIQQRFPAKLFEIIVVNDQSTDATQQVVDAFIKQHTAFQLRCLNIESTAVETSYKKKAIAMAIEQATGALIVTTDADCTVKEDWLNTLVVYYEQYRPVMIAGPVAYYKEQSFFERMQTLEFLSLIGIGAASITLQKPVMCNGANLAYTREAFYEVNGFTGFDDIASGDDTFLMFKMNKTFKGDVHFLKSREAIVYTEAKSTVAEFINQRKRWASKTTKYNDAFITMVGAAAYLLNALLLLLLIVGCFNAAAFSLFVRFFVVKTVIDLIFLLPVVSFFKRRQLLWLLIPEQFLYIFYIVIVGAMAPFGKYTWKGRDIK